MRADYGREQALYEGFCMNFLTQLDNNSRDQLKSRIKQVFAPTLNQSQLRYAPPDPSFGFGGVATAGIAAQKAATNAQSAADSEQDRRRKARRLAVARGLVAESDKKFVKVANFWIEQGPQKVNDGQVDEVDQVSNTKKRN